MLKIEEIRRSIGITQERLSELSGLNSRWIRKLESGEITLENITVVNMVKLLKGLSAAEDELGEPGRAFEDFSELKHAYIVTKALLDKNI